MVAAMCVNHPGTPATLFTVGRESGWTSNGTVAICDGCRYDIVVATTGKKPARSFGCPCECAQHRTVIDNDIYSSPATLADINRLLALGADIEPMMIAETREIVGYSLIPKRR